MERSRAEDQENPPGTGAEKRIQDESRAELYQRARAMNIPHAVSMSHEELRAAIEAASDVRAAPPVLDRPGDGVAVGQDAGAPDDAQMGHAEKKSAESVAARFELEKEPRGVLYERARRMGIPHTVSMSREQLIAAIEAGSHQTPATASEDHGSTSEDVPAPHENATAGNGVERPVAGVAEVEERSGPPPDLGAGVDRGAPGEDRAHTAGVWSAVRRERFLLFLLGVSTALVIGLGAAWLAGAIEHQRRILRAELAAAVTLWIVVAAMLVLGVRRTLKMARASS